MIPLPPSTRIFLACGATDMRKGFDGLAVMTQQVLEQSPHSGALFAFRGKRGDLVKLLWYDGQGMCLFSKRMDRGRFVWPSTKTGSVVMTAAQLSMLLEGIDWRRPERILPRHSRAKTAIFRCFFWHCGRCSAIGSWCRTQAFPPLTKTLGSPSSKLLWRPPTPIFLPATS